ncbi:MAG: hypothetical protein QW648_02030 [Nanoarchaeales archaeon]
MESSNVNIRDPVLFYGARVVHTTSTSPPDYGLAIQPQRVGNPHAVVTSVPVAINFDASFIVANLTTSALSANATYTSGTIDGLNKRGAGLFIRSDQPVQIEIQESHDGGTFARTRVYYLGLGPGIVFHGYILFPLANRFWRVLITNLGYANQTTFRVDRIEKYDVQNVEISQYIATVERTTTPLGANATYTSRTYILQNVENVSFYAFADQPGTVFVDISFDGTTWRVLKSYQVSANTTVSDIIIPVGRVMRLRYVNGSTAQSTFEFSISVANKI